jgi:hypothetical protein
MQGIEIPIGAPLRQLDKDLKAAQAKLKQYTSFTDAELRRSSMANYAVQQKVLNVNENLAEAAAKAAKALRLKAAETQAATIASGGFLNKTKKLYSGIKTLANILPGVGVAGLFALALDPLISLISKLDIFNSKLSESAKLRNSLNAAVQKGNEDAGKEISTLKILYDEATNVANSSELRNKAALELQKIFPETFKNVSLEAIKTGELKDSYNELTDSIIANARAKAIADKIGELSSKLLAADIQNQKILIAQSNELARVKGPLIATSAGDTMGGGVGMETIQTVAQQKQIINNRAKAAIDLNNINKKIVQNEIDFLRKFTTADAIVKAVSKDEPLKNLKEGAKTTSDILKDLSVDFKQIGADFSITFGKANQEKVAALKKAINGLIKIGVGVDSSIIKNLQEQLLSIDPAKITEKGKEIGVNAAVGIGAGIASAGPVVAKNFQNVIKTFTEFEQQLNSIVEGGLEQTLAGIGNAIGESLSTGTSLVQNLGATLLGSLSSVLGQLGQLAIATGVAMLGIKFAFKNPFSAIAAGVALLALSGAVRGQANKITDGVGSGGGGSSGGRFSAPLPAQSSSISTSAAGSAQDFGGGRVVFEISGNNLVGVLNRAGAQLKRYGP